MKIAAASDWRERLPFETPVVLAEVLPGDDARCSVCGGTSDPLPRTELWAVKHRHPKHHDGHVRFYCAEHVPVVRRAAPQAPPAPAARRSAPREPRQPAVRRPAASDRVRAMCPECFIEVAANGVCGNCGTVVSP